MKTEVFLDEGDAEPNPHFGEPEPIAVGETTSLGERKITNANYLPLTSPIQLLMSRMMPAVASKIVAAGINPDDVTHVTIRLPDTVAPGGDITAGIYVSTDPRFVGANGGINLPVENEDNDQIVYTRVH